MESVESYEAAYHNQSQSNDKYLLTETTIVLELIRSLRAVVMSGFCGSQKMSELFLLPKKMVVELKRWPIPSRNRKQLINTSPHTILCLLQLEHVSIPMVYTRKITSPARKRLYRSAEEETISGKLRD